MNLVVSVDGRIIRGLLRASISSNNYYSSDSFSIGFAAGQPPLEDIDAWLAMANGLITVSQQSADFVDTHEIISGRADSIEADPIFKTVSIDGRDLSASLIDSYAQQDFVNQTASEVVSSIAAQYNLLPQVTPTQGNVGRYFGDGYTRLSLGEFSRFRSNWDLIVELARSENFDVFVQGASLFYQPAASLLNNSIIVRPTDVIRLRLQQNLCVTQASGVKIQSWNAQQTSAYVAAAGDGQSPSRAVLPNQSPAYLFSSPNLTASQTDTYAQRYAREVNRLRAIVDIEMPWDLAICPRYVLLLEGFSASVDGPYIVDCVDRHFSSTSGSFQSIKAVAWAVAL